MLAVLYTDQVGSTAMSNALGDEHFDGLRREIESAIDNAVVRSGGTVLKRTGDGALAVFESAADAIDASVLLHTEVDLIKARGDHKPVMRIGLSVGDVSLESGDAFGAPVVEAARLEAAARQPRAGPPRRPEPRTCPPTRHSRPPPPARSASAACGHPGP